MGKRMLKLMFREELDIQHRLLNLILCAAFIGGTCSFIVTIAIGGYASAAVTAVLLFVVLVSLYLSVIRSRTTVAAVLITGMANMFIFPWMYFNSGGMNSGMPIWFVLGLIFTWLTLKGRICYVMYACNLVSLIGCILIGESHPEWFKPMPEGFMRAEMVKETAVLKLAEKRAEQIKAAVPKTAVEYTKAAVEKAMAENAAAKETMVKKTAAWEKSPQTGMRTVLETGRNLPPSCLQQTGWEKCKTVQTQTGQRNITCYPSKSAEEEKSQQDWLLLVP